LAWIGLVLIGADRTGRPLRWAAFGDVRGRSLLDLVGSWDD
jgi:hypothetical protein